MWKNSCFVPVLFICFITYTNAQDKDMGLYLDLHFGIGRVLNLVDQTAETYSINGSSFMTIIGGNIETFSARSPCVYIALTKPLTSRWSGGLFVRYLFDNAELFEENRRSIVAPNGLRKIAESFPSKRKFRWFNLGAMVYYQINGFKKYKGSIFLKNWNSTLGIGLIAAITKHYYRTELKVDYNSDLEIISHTETFSDIRRKLAGIPLYFRHNYLLNDQMSLNAGIQTQTYFKGDFLEVGWFVGLSYQLE